MGMSQGPSGGARSTAYARWRQGLADSLDLDFDALDPNVEVQDWLLAVHRGNGDLPVDRLVPLVHARRAHLAAAAVAALHRSCAADGHADPAVPLIVRLPSPSAPMGLVQVGDQEIQLIDRQGVAVEAADGFQTHLADVRALIWPTCSTHNNGAHPRLVSGTGVWQCPATGHLLGPIAVP